MTGNNEIVEIDPRILVWARTRINMSISEVARKLKKDEQIIQNWENGSELPSLAQLEKLAYNIYKVPFAVFFLAEPPDEPQIKNQFRTIPTQEIELLPYELMLKVREGQYFQEVLKEIFNGKNPSLTPIFRRINNFSESNLLGSSKDVRKILGVNKSIQSNFKDTTESFKYYREQLEKNGIFVFQQTLKDFCRGYSLYDPEFPIIVINSSEESDTGKNFTIFHELGHLLLNTGGITNDYTYNSHNAEEITCNSFASNVLIDNNEILNNQLVINNKSYEWSEELLRILAKDHKVSKEVVLRKLLDLKLTSSVFYNTKRNEWLNTPFKRKKSGGGDFYRNKLSKLGHYYSTIVLNNLYNGRINQYQASEYLTLKINQIPIIERLVFK
jgi:Zn-dependent peptidase ImmA (M78 family)/transcriptional regulator with XRE-family HTH domain